MTAKHTFSAQVIEIAKDAGINRGGLQASIGVARTDMNAMDREYALKAMVAFKSILEAAESAEKE